MIADARQPSLEWRSSEEALTPSDRITLLRKHYAFQQGCFVSDQHETSSGLFAFSGITPIPMWNHAAWFGQGSAEFEAFLRSSKEWQSRKNRRPVVYIAEPELAQVEALRTAGFEPFDEEAWMVLDADESSHSMSHEAVEVQDEHRLKDFLETFSAAFHIKEEGYAKVLSWPDLQDAVRSRHFVLYDGNKPVSVGTLISDGELACIYNVGTPPDHRKKGYGARIFEHIVAAARQEGCSRLFLQVENRSAAMRLYEKLGFQTAFVRIGYRDTQWRSALPQRTRLSNLLGYRPREAAAIQYVRETRPIPAEIWESLKALDNDAFQRAFIASWAFLLHRYTGDEITGFTVKNQPADSRRSVWIHIELAERIESWLANLNRNQRDTGGEATESSIEFSMDGNVSHFATQEAPLQVYVPRHGESMEIIFRTDLFSKDSIRRMGTHLVTALGFIITNPERRVGEIELLSPSEKHQLLVDWNQNSFEGTTQTLIHLFEKQVERTPEATALILAGDRSSGIAEQITYRQLNRKANRLAHRLQELGVGPEVFVGVCLYRSPEMVVCLLAILKAGGACVPLDPAYPAERIRFMLRDSAAPILLTEESLAPEFRGLPHVQVLCLDRADASRKGESERNPAPRAALRDAAYMIYTSGSTGKPKGVVITQGAIANHCVDCKTVYGLSDKDRVLQFSSFNFDAAFEQILPALISGACLAIRGEDVWTTRQFADTLRELRLTVADIPTAYWHQLAEEWSKNPEAVPPNHLRLVIVGGEALSPEKLALWQSTPLGRTRLINAYGPTEATITATSFEVPPRENGDAPMAVLPIGRPRGDRKVYVLDRHGNPAPIGVPGELHIGGTMLARGYHNRPELTSSRFIPNPFSDEPDERLYRTGDLVRYLEDGNLEFLGRMDDQVKVRGFRIELGEIESCLRKHPSVREAMVLARPDDRGEKRLVAYVTYNGARPEPKSLRDHLKRRLPDYMAPSGLVLLESWPLLPNGKVDRQALPEPAPEFNPESGKGPEDPLELQLQLLFERVLKRAPVEVDVSFFELGGDSLQALELLVEIEKATGKQLPMGTLYQSSTVQSLAREVRGLEGTEKWSSLVPLQTSGTRPALFLLHTTPGDILGYGNLVYRLGPDQPCYGFQSLGLKEADLSHRSIHEMARYYAGLLRTFQPHGPYYLGGWCYGGIVAVELARILRQEGEEIGLLALLETVAAPPRCTNFRYYLHRLACFLRMSPARWITYFRAKARYARESRIANRLRFRQSEHAAPGESRDPRLARLEHVYNTNLAALDQYASVYYDGRVTLFNAAEKDPALIPDPQYGWIGLAREIEIYEVPGNHDTMLTEPNVSALASALNECLVHSQQNYKPNQA